MQRAIASIALLLAAGVAAADDLNVREVFVETSEAPPERYVLGRDLLLSAGAAVEPVMAAHLDDTHPGRRALAQYLRISRERPEQCASWTEALNAPWGDVTRDESDVPRALLRYSKRGSRGQHLEYRQVLFWPGSEWFLIDALREPPGRRSEQAARALGILGAAEAAPLLATRLSVHWDAQEAAPYVDALVAIGEPSLAPVRAMLAGENPTAAASAADVLARLGDAASADRLVAIASTTSADRLFNSTIAALHAIDPARGADAALDRLLERASIRGRRSHSNVHYVDVRDALCGMGDAAVPTLAARRDGAGTVAAAIIDGVLWELSEPELAAAAYRRVAAESDAGRRGWGGGRDEDGDTADVGRWAFWGRYAAQDAPLPLLRERSAAFGEVDDLTACVRRGTERDHALAAIALGGLLRRNGGEELVVTLAERGPAVALDVVEAALAAERPPQGLGRYVEALILLVDQPRTAGVLARIAERLPDPDVRRPHDQIHAEAAPIAAAALAVARGEVQLAALLAHEQPRVQLAAARGLARRGDPAGVDVLARAAIGLRSMDYRALRDDIVRTGVLPAIGDEEPTVFDAVMRAATAFRIAEPVRSAEIDLALLRAQPVDRSIIGPQPHDYERAGHTLAHALGPDARPLLEEAALFGLLSRVAIHAVGKLGHEASIPVLLRCARVSPEPAAAALRAMGEKGMAAARTVPPPDPAKADYGGRAGRHMAAADSLAGVEGGSEKVLEGLAEVPPEDRRARDEWARRMENYLDAALGRRNDGAPPPPRGEVADNPVAALDPRLLEATLQLIADHGAQHARLRQAAFRVLARFQDDRIAVAALPYLPHRWYDSEGRYAMAALSASLGDRVVPFLVERASRDGIQEGIQRGTLHALWRTVAQSPTATRADRDTCAALLRADCTGDDAATDLLKLHTQRPEDERDPRDMATILRYVATSDAPGMVVEALAKLNPPGTAEALLASYRRAQDFRALHALATLRHEPAAADVHRRAERRLKEDPDNRWRHREFDALVKLGATGLQMMRDFLDPARPLETRIVAASSLGTVADASSYDTIVALLNEVEPLPIEPKSEVDHVRAVSWALARVDARRAHAEFIRRSLSGPAMHRTAYAALVASLRSRNPELASELPSLGGAGD